MIISADQHIVLTISSLIAVCSMFSIFVAGVCLSVVWLIVYMGVIDGADNGGTAGVEAKTESRWLRIGRR